MNDFNNTKIIITFEPDEFIEIDEMSAPILVFDDAINEATEQVFVVELQLVSSLDQATVDLATRPTSLCMIIDNDRKCKEYVIETVDHTKIATIAIGVDFELSEYTYKEPQFEEFIDEFYVSPTGRPENGPIYLVKINNMTSEQTFLVSIQVTDVFGTVVGLDYRLGQAGQASVHNVTEHFNASQQRVPFRFTLLPDTLPEGPEAFLASLCLKDAQLLPDGTEETFPTTSLISASEVFIIILDDDRKFP